MNERMTTLRQLRNRISIQAPSARRTEVLMALDWILEQRATLGGLLAQESDAADALLHLMGFDPSACRTDGGSLKLPRVTDLWNEKVAQLARDIDFNVRRATGPKRAASWAFAAVHATLGPAPQRPPNVGARHPMAAEADRLAGVL